MMIKRTDIDENKVIKMYCEKSLTQRKIAKSLGCSMTKQVFEGTFNVKLVNKKDSLLMRIVGVLLYPFTPDFMTNFFTTYRLPGQKHGTIAYPAGADPMKFPEVLEHELMHVEQQSTALGLFKSAIFVSVFPLPVLFSGRWFIEREPYLNDIKKGRRTVEESVDVLWGSYGLAWPKPLMRKWFNERL